jgi:hypothetical protein
MHYKLLADGVFAFHMFWIACLLLGWLVSKRMHIWAVVTTITAQILFLGCPLTALEMSLRRKYDPYNHQYTGSFMCHLLHKWFSIQVPSWAITACLGIIATLVATALLIDYLDKPTLPEAST